MIVLWDLAIHDLSILSTFTDLAEVTEVCAHGSHHFGTQEEDAHLHLKYASGFAAHIHVSWLSPVKLLRSLLGGTKAMIMFNDIEPSEKLRLYDRGVDHDTTKPDPFFPKYRAGDVLIPALPMTETLTVEAKHVLTCIAEKKMPIVDGEAGLKIVRILETAQTSLQNGSAISLAARA